MRVSGLYVDGFGLLHDLHVEDVGPGTTVVLGPNEAGKSTLHAFIVGTLFGHPRRNDAAGRPRHEPLAGGRHGGWVAVHDEDGQRWVVHRTTVGSPRLRVVRPDGSEATGEGALRGLVADDVDRDGFEQVHAIDLDALSGLASLGGDALQDLLFDAATVGTGRSLRRAHAEAVDTRDALWTPTATARPLAAALTERDEARATLDDARRAAARFTDQRRRRDELAARVDALRDRREALTVEDALLARVVEAWPAHQRRAEAAAAVGDEDAPPVLAGVLDRARAAEHAAREADVELDRLRDELAAVTDELDRADTVDALAEVADEVAVVHRRAAVHEGDVQRLRRAEGAQREARAILDAALAEIGDGWDVDRLATVATDATVRERLGVAAAALVDARRELAAARRRVDELAAVVERRQTTVARRRQGRTTAPPVDQVRRAEEAIAVLRGRIPALEQAALLRQARAGGATGRDGPDVPSALRLLPGWFGRVAVAVAAVLLALGSLVTEGTLETVTFVALALLVTVPTGFLAGRLLGEGRARWQADHEADEVTRIATDTDVAAAIAREVDEAAGLLGIASPPTLTDVERVAGRVAEARASVAHVDRLDRELAELEDELAVEEREAQRARAAAEEADAVLDNAEQRWQQACTAVGLDVDEPSVVTVLHDRVTAAVRAVVAVDRVRADVDELRAAVASFQRDAAAVVHAASGREVAPDGTAVAALEELAAAVERDTALRATLADRRGRRDELARAVERARARRDEHAATLARVLDETGVDDLRGLAVAAEEGERRRRARDERDSAARTLVELLGRGDAAAAAHELLATADPVGWAGRRTAIAEQVERVDTERDAAVREHTTVAAEVQRLGGDDAVPRAAQRLAAAQTAVDALAERWVVADGTVRVLAQATASFEGDRHPAVLVAAGRLLAVATLGAWTGLRQLDGRLVASRSTARDGGPGEPVPVEALSRGTQEQLYLCLRLALAADRSERTGRPLPLVVDDLLGTTDPERARAVARVLAEVASRQQVWLFTCDPRTATLVTAADPSAAVLALARGGRLEGWRVPPPALRREAAPSVAEQPPSLPFDDD